MKFLQFLLQGCGVTGLVQEQSGSRDPRINLADDLFKVAS